MQSIGSARPQPSLTHRSKAPQHCEEHPCPAASQQISSVARAIERCWQGRNFPDALLTDLPATNLAAEKSHAAAWGRETLLGCGIARQHGAWRYSCNPTGPDAGKTDPTSIQHEVWGAKQQLLGAAPCMPLARILVLSPRPKRPIRPSFSSTICSGQ